MIQIPALNFAAIAPELVLLTGALFLLMVDAFAGEAVDRYLGWAGVLFAVAAAAVAIPGFRQPVSEIMGGMLYGGRVGALAAFWISLASAASMVVLQRFGEVRRGSLAAMAVLMLMAATGGILLARAAHLAMLFLALELLSIPLYALCAYDRSDSASGESGIKYFIIGSVGSAVALYGIALLYGATGSLSLETLGTVSVGKPLVMAGYGLLVSGVFLKLSIVPLHFWTADVYEGAPTPVTMFMAAVVKIAAFGLLFRLVATAPQLADALYPVMYILAMLTMVVGNLMALVQDNLKRMLAFSSIAHAGYILAAVVAGGTGGFAAAYNYLWVYVLATISSFGLLVWFDNEERRVETFDDLSGLSTQHPWASFFLAVTMLSLGSIPPTAGFFPKLMILEALAGQQLYLLAIVMVLASAVGAYYYLRVIVHLYFREQGDKIAVGLTYGRIVSGGLFALISGFILLLGVRPNGLWTLAEKTASMLLGG